MSPNPTAIAQAWCDQMQGALRQNDVPAIVAQFRPDGWWRDILNLDFDFNSLTTNSIPDFLKNHGVPKISNLKVIQEEKSAIVPVSPEITWLQAFLSYETPEGRGKGFLRLRETTPGSGDWKAYTFFTALWEIKGHEEFAYDRRPLGAEHGEHQDARNWLDRRKERTAYADSEPSVLIIGAGQNGIMLSARLTALGIPTLLLERNARLGDSWRNRYHTLCLHDPVFADHFPYIAFPPHWPIYQPKDKIANWFESYAESMELDFWLSSTIEPNPVFDETTKKWTVKVLRDGAPPRTMRVNHLVLASGFSGEPKIPTFPQDDYKGVVCHSSRHKGAQGDWKGKKVVVIGANNSAQDISADFVEHGADVTMVQRSHTYVMSSKHGIPGLLTGFWEEHGPPLDDADLMFTSLPITLVEAFQTAATTQITIKDKDMLDGLTKAGFKLNPYPAGLFIKYFRDGGGYFIDVGSAAMIADGRIKIKQGKNVKKLTKAGVLMEDGVELPADMIVFATGYSSMRETIRRVISPDVADRVGPVWGSDAQGEIPVVWRNSGVSRFYIQCGNMFQARCFSKHVALQIQMIDLGLAKENVYPKYKEVADPRF